jgi:hypothetical protein
MIDHAITKLNLPIGYPSASAEMNNIEESQKDTKRGV